jgi:hypothetical protein
MPSKHEGGSLKLEFQNAKRKYTTEDALTHMHLIAYYTGAHLEPELITLGSCTVFLYEISNLGFEPLCPEDTVPTKVAEALNRLRKKVCVIPLSPNREGSKKKTPEDDAVIEALENLTDNGNIVDYFTATVHVLQEGWSDRHDQPDTKLGRVSWKCTDITAEYAWGTKDSFKGKDDKIWSALRLGMPVLSYLNQENTMRYCVRDTRKEAATAFANQQYGLHGSDVEEDSEDDETGYEWERGNTPDHSTISLVC